MSRIIINRSNALPTNGFITRRQALARLGTGLVATGLTSCAVYRGPKSPLEELMPKEPGYVGFSAHGQQYGFDVRGEFEREQLGALVDVLRLYSKRLLDLFAHGVSTSFHGCERPLIFWFSDQILDLRSSRALYTSGSVGEVVIMRRCVADRRFRLDVAHELGHAASDYLEQGPFRLFGDLEIGEFDARLHNDLLAHKAGQLQKALAACDDAELRRQLAFYLPLYLGELGKFDIVDAGQKAAFFAFHEDQRVQDLLRRFFTSLNAWALNPYKDTDFTPNYARSEYWAENCGFSRAEPTTLEGCDRPLAGAFNQFFIDLDAAEFSPALALRNFRAALHA